MTTLQYIHFSTELAGAFFCIVATSCIYISRNFDKKGSLMLINLMACSTMLMISDALAWLFRGNPSEAGYYIVRIANFSAFLFGFLTMPLVAEYISHIISKRSGIEGLYWKYIEWGLFSIGTALLILNLFREFIYSFDENNTYYRLGLGTLPGIISFVGVVIALGIVFEYIKYMKKFEKVAIIIYLFLPMVALVVQIFRYGVSFTYLSIVISALMIFISYEVNYADYQKTKDKQI